MNSYAVLEKILCWEAIVFLTGIFVAIARQTLTHRINLAGLLAVHDGTRETSPTRVQLLLFTVAYALYYLMQILHSPTGFPRIPHEILYLLGGSHSAYLVAKGYVNSKLSPAA